MHLPRIIIDPMIYRKLTTIGATTKSLKNLRICYFGEKNKVLSYNIEKDDWKLSHLPLGQHYEFNYYSSAVTLPNGNVLITGGGISNSVCEVNLVSQGRNNPPGVEINLRAPMNQTRKEHASVLL
mmetsp:Transcript_35370/g.31840  ORF Transcript_35370/g.31840 Transcript_35370/m.31840 type:complete len:125 (+) Transcript_35370:508-882(+)